MAAGTLIAAAASIAADTPAAPQAASPSGSPGWHHRHRGGEGFLYAKLGLSDEQKAQIKSIHQAAAPQMKSLFEQMHSNAARLQGMSPADPNYLTTVQEVHQLNAPLQAQLATQRASLQQQIFTKVLNGSQQTQLLQMKQQMHERMLQHMQSGGAGTGA